MLILVFFFSSTYVNEMIISPSYMINHMILTFSIYTVIIYTQSMSYIFLYDKLIVFLLQISLFLSLSLNIVRKSSASRNLELIKEFL